MSYSIFPILKDFDRNFVKKRNHLRDKYPDVPFKDEDISFYDYGSSEPESFLMEQFLEQYNVKDLLITTDFGNGNLRKYYLYDIKLIPGLTDERYKLLCKNFRLDYDGFIIDLDINETEFWTLRQSLKIKNHFKLYMDWHNDAKINIEINPDRKVLGDYVSSFIDQLLSDYNEESIIYKHPNGIQYYTENCCINKKIEARIRREEEKSYIEFKIEKDAVVEPFKKYNDGYAIKSMHKKSRKITFAQMRLEFISLCNHVIKNKIKFTKKKWYYAEHIKPLFKGQSFIFNYSTEGENYKDYYLITDFIEKRKDTHIESVGIKKKDKHIGSFESFKKVDSKIKDNIIDFLVEKFDDDLDFTLMDDLEHFTSVLDLDLYENEEYSGDYFLYENTFDFGKYKITVNSSKYIKDQCICDLSPDSIDIYEKK